MISLMNFREQKNSELCGRTKNRKLRAEISFKNNNFSFNLFNLTRISASFFSYCLSLSDIQKKINAAKFPLTPVTSMEHCTWHYRL